MPGDWARYWRADEVPVEAMHAHFSAHVYHRHSHESYSFGVTETGAQAFTCRHGRHVSVRGMVMAFNPDDPHDGHAADGDGFTYRMVHIWPELLTSLTGSPLPLFRSPLLEDPAVAAAVRRLHLALTGPDRETSELERYERLSGAARLLVRHASGREPARGGTDRGVAARVRELIRASTGELRAGELSADGLSPGGLSPGRLSPGGLSTGRLSPEGLSTGELTADDLAAAAGCSRYAAYRAFTQAYGLAPSDYQRQLRVQAARRLLGAGVAPAQAAAAAGFADQAHLTRWFRRYYGVTPGAYRAAAGGPEPEVGRGRPDQGRR
jgi:AraC-like DNA-binding protein